MTCAEHQRRLSAYIDAQLPPAEREALDVHLAACAGCREALTTLQTMLQSLKTLAVGQAPDVWPAVRAQLKSAPQAAPRAVSPPARATSAWHLTWPVHGAALMMGAVLLAVVLDVPERARPARRVHTALSTVRASGETGERSVASAGAKAVAASITEAGANKSLADVVSVPSAAVPLTWTQQGALGSAGADERALARARAEMPAAPVAMTGVYDSFADAALGSSAAARTVPAQQAASTSQLTGARAGGFVAGGFNAAAAMRVGMGAASAEQRGTTAELKTAAPPSLLLLWIALAPEETIIEAISAWLPSVNGRVVSTEPYLTVELPAGHYGALREELSRVGQYYDDEIPEVHVHTDLRSTPLPNVPPATLLTVEIHLLAAE